MGNFVSTVQAVIGTIITKHRELKNASPINELNDYVKSVKSATAVQGYAKGVESRSSCADVYDSDGAH